MREVTITKKVFKFDELSDKAKEKSRDWYRQLAANDDWWDAIYGDAVAIAKIMGITIDDRAGKTLVGITTYEPKIWFSGFSSQGDGACFEGTYRYAKDCVRNLKSYAPKDEELHRIVEGLAEIQKRHQYAVWAKVTHSGHCYHNRCTEFDTDGLGDNTDDEESLTELLRDFMQWIYDTLKKEHDYLNSDERVDEDLTDREYEFLENGSLFVGEAGDTSASSQDEQSDIRTCLEDIEEWLDGGFVNGVHYDEQSIADSIRAVLSKLPKREPVEGEFEVN